MTLEQVVLVDEDGAAIGTADKLAVHSAETPLHLAFSCHVYSPAGEVLVTRRAMGKLTWPGVWTNSFCGHPRPGETFEAAVLRYAGHELGTGARDLECVLPDFRYRAVDASGVVENEVCPVFVATCTGEADGLDPNPDEVAEWRWVTPDELGSAVAGAPWALSPWLLEQVAEIEAVDGWTTLRP